MTQSRLGMRLLTYFDLSHKGLLFSILEEIYLRFYRGDMHYFLLTSELNLCMNLLLYDNEKSPTFRAIGFFINLQLSPLPVRATDSSLIRLSILW